MVTRITINGKAKGLDVVYSANLFKDEPQIEGNPINGLYEVEARITGGGVNIERVYLSTGQFRPSETASRLSDEENNIILTQVMELFAEYGNADKEE